MELRTLSPAELCELLSREGIHRFFLVWDEEAGRVRASHPLLEPLARWLEEDRRDFDRHEGVFVQVAPESGVLQSACVHRTCRGQGAGGVRYWRYDTVEDYLRDGLRLARGMTHKNALAGLWWGGGKGVMARGTGLGSADPAARRLIYEEYGAFITSLQGCYVTAEDVGTSVEDMAAVYSRTRFTTCIPASLGGAEAVPNSAAPDRTKSAARSSSRRSRPPSAYRLNQAPIVSRFTPSILATTERERATFRELLKISGVGPRTALAILSGLSVAELERDAPFSVEQFRTLNRCLDNAIAVMEESELVAETLGEHTFDFFLRNKRAEWEEYRTQVSAFERDRMLPVI